MFRAADIQGWLAEARQLGLTDAKSQRGILFLELLLSDLTPTATVLLPNYPNPFTPGTWIPYKLAEPEDVRVEIYAADGKVVRTLELGHQSAGSYIGPERAAYWAGRTNNGELVANGVYFYHLQAGNFSEIRRMAIVK